LISNLHFVAPDRRSVTVCAAAEPEADVIAASRRGLLAAAAAAIAVSLAPAADAKVAQKAPDPYEVGRETS
jgi:hypothetical protein